jgi:SAM-dependent methyltransferase
MNWESLDWEALDRLREQFLRGHPAGPYWTSANDLASYDATYAERIGWKWDHVLRELRLRGWRPSSRTVFDWGCGSGIAARRVIAAFGAGNFDALTVWDHSPLACDFAAESAQRSFPALKIDQATPGFLASTEPIGLLLVSHVLTEVTPDQLAALVTLVDRAEAVLWVEPGTHESSRELGAIRDDLRGEFHIVAPCTHESSCPILRPDAARHWCHHFAPPPAEIFSNPNWVKFGQRAGIDLRSLPYSFLALDRQAPPAIPPDAARIIGRPEHLKPYARLLSCDESGLAELELPKRADPALYKQLERTRAPLVYRWTRDGDKILGGEALGATGR